MSTPITEGKLAVVNIGVDTFMASLVAGGAPAISLDWRPAGDGDPVRRIVLAAEPAGGLPAMLANRELVRLLALDPVFQLK